MLRHVLYCSLYIILHCFLYYTAEFAYLMVDGVLILKCVKNIFDSCYPVCDFTHLLY